MPNARPPILLKLSAPRAQAAGVLTFLPRFQSSSPERESWLLCGFASTFGPTRSGTGNAHASGQALPLIRTLLDTLVCEPQPRLRTSPGNDILRTRAARFCSINAGGQLAFLGGLPASHLLVGFAAFPVQLLLASLLDAPLLVVVVGIGGAPLSLHLALEPADVLLIRG